MRLYEIVEQLEKSCNHECAKPLVNNIAFFELKKKAKAEGCPNWGKQGNDTIGPCYECGWCKRYL